MAKDISKDNLDETEVEETTEEESTETPEQEQIEDNAGTEGVVIPEEFQSSIHGIVQGANKAELAFLRDRIYAREDELRQEEQKKAEAQAKKGGKKVNVPDSFSTADMPR